MSYTWEFQDWQNSFDRHLEEYKNTTDSVDMQFHYEKCVMYADLIAGRIVINSRAPKNYKGKMEGGNV